MKKLQILGPVDVDAKPGDPAACICPKCSAQRL
jgi:hypothetical protein